MKRSLVGTEATSRTEDVPTEEKNHKDVRGAFRDIIGTRDDPLLDCLTQSGFSSEPWLTAATKKVRDSLGLRRSTAPGC